MLRVGQLTMPIFGRIRQVSSARPLNPLTYQVKAIFEVLDEGVLMVPSVVECNQVGFKLISVQVCITFGRLK